MLVHGNVTRLSFRGRVGLRRWIKAPISQGAWVRIPPGTWLFSLSPAFSLFPISPLSLPLSFLYSAVFRALSLVFRREMCFSCLAFCRGPAGQRAANEFLCPGLSGVCRRLLCLQPPPPPPPGKNSRGVNASSTHLGEAAAAALRLSTGEDSCLIRASVSCSTGWHRTVGRPDFLKGVL